MFLLNYESPLGCKHNMYGHVTSHVTSRALRQLPTSIVMSWFTNIILLLGSYCHAPRKNNLPVQNHVITPVAYIINVCLYFYLPTAHVGINFFKLKNLKLLLLRGRVNISL